MSSPCPIRLALGGAAVLGLTACHMNNAPASHSPAVVSSAPLPAESHLYPGEPPPPNPDPRLIAYQTDPANIAAGTRYYTWYNCTGCHFNGGGGIGPAFMDATWRYGGSLEEIHNSIAQGRPNGMPVWGGKIPDPQIWQIAAYVHSLSAPSSEAKPGATLETPPPPTPVSNKSGGATSGKG